MSLRRPCGHYQHSFICYQVLEQGNEKGVIPPTRRLPVRHLCFRVMAYSLHDPLMCYRGSIGAWIKNFGEEGIEDA